MPGKATSKPKVSAPRRVRVPKPPPRPKPTSYECSACAVRTATWFQRCPSCGQFRTCFAWLDPARRALELPRSGNPWDEVDPNLVGQDGSMRVRGSGYGGGYGGVDDASGSENDEDDEDEDEDDDEEEVVVGQHGSLVLPKTRLLSRVKATVIEHVPSGYDAFDEVTIGGAVTGTVSGWTAFPGVGKSTFLLEALAAYASTGVKCAYASAEEPEGDISARAERLGLYDTYKGSRQRLIIIAAETADPDAELSDKDVARAKRQEEALLDIRAVIAAADKRGARYLVIDSASRMSSKEVVAPDGKIGGKDRQLAHVVKTCYSRAHRQHEYRGFPPMTIFVILHSTKTGDSNVPQGFIHDLDSTFVGEHITVKESEKNPPEIDAASNQKKPSGLVWFRSHGKNRGGDVTARTILHMTARGLTRVGNEEEAIHYFYELRRLQKSGVMAQKRGQKEQAAAQKEQAPNEPSSVPRVAPVSPRKGSPDRGSQDAPVESYSLAGDDEGEKSAPATKKPATKKPAAKKPAAKKPATKKPATKPAMKPTAKPKKPTAKKPATSKKAKR